MLFWSQICCLEIGTLVFTKGPVPVLLLHITSVKILWEQSILIQCGFAKLSIAKARHLLQFCGKIQGSFQQITCPVTNTLVFTIVP